MDDDRSPPDAERWNAVGEHLRSIREGMGLNKSEAAELSGISPSTWAMLEDGGRNVRGAWELPNPTDRVLLGIAFGLQILDDYQPDEAAKTLFDLAGIHLPPQPLLTRRFREWQRATVPQPVPPEGTRAEIRGGGTVASSVSSRVPDPTVITSSSTVTADGTVVPDGVSFHSAVEGWHLLTDEEKEEILRGVRRATRGVLAEREDRRHT